MNRSTPLRRTPMKRAAPEPAAERTRAAAVEAEFKVKLRRAALAQLSFYNEMMAAKVRAAVEAEQRKRMQTKFAKRAPTPATADFDLPAPNDARPIRPQPKDGRYVSEQWRRAVASLNCVQCGIEGQTQAAHANHRGKGMAMKAPDCWTFPLCAPCHREFDQGSSYTKEMRRELADDWIIKTIKELAVRGLIRA